jgi:uncharacterized repeat protein (TIGR04076 family)
MAEQVGYKVIGTFTGLKGQCNHGHKVGDTVKLSAHDTSGMCGFFYYAIYPYIMMLQFGGRWPDSWGGDTLEFDCPDKYNCLSIRLQPEKAA